MQTPPFGAPGNSDLIDAWIAECVFAGQRPRTIEMKRSVLRNLARDLGPVPLAEATETALLSWLGNRRWGAQTRDSYRARIRDFYGWASRRTYIGYNPARDLPPVKVPRRLPRPLPRDDVTMALAMARGRIRWAITLAAYAGLRACEIAPFRGEDVVDGAWLRIRVAKGGAEQAVPAHSAVLEVAREAPAGWWFPRRDFRGHMTSSNLSTEVRTFLRGLGIDGHCHQLRHSYGSSLYEQSGDLRVVQELLRHASPSYTALYTKVTDTRRAAVLSALTY
jgi:integrase